MHNLGSLVSQCTENLLLLCVVSPKTKKIKSKKTYSLFFFFFFEDRISFKQLNDTSPTWKNFSCMTSGNIA